jgi:hypothetical protein
MEPPRDLRELLEESLKYIEAVVEGRTRSAQDALGASLRRALDLYSMEIEERRPRLELALLANLAEGRKHLAQLLAIADEENARQDMYWGEMGPDPRYPAPRCAFRLDEFSCRLEAGHGGRHAVLVEWETDEGGVVQPSLSPE